MSYSEYFNVDSTRAHWALRRDISLGRSEGQMFMTTDGILIFRCVLTREVRVCVGGEGEGAEGWACKQGGA